MGDHADDAIEAGMCEEFPFGRRSSRRYHRPRQQPKPKPKPLCPDDQFMNWHDHEHTVLRNGEPVFTLYEMSRFDMAAAAWHEAWKRATQQAGDK